MTGRAMRPMRCGRRGLACLLAIGAVTLSPPVHAGAPTLDGHDLTWPLPCLHEAAARQRIAPALLQAIVWVESRGSPWALHINRPGRPRSVTPSSWGEAVHELTRFGEQGASVDVGLAQVNTRQARRLHLHPVWLLDPCVNLQWAAWILRELIEQHGETWTAIMRYNGRNPAYAWKVAAAWAAFRETGRPPEPVWEASPAP